MSIVQDTTLRLDARTFVEPDFCVFRRDLDLQALDGSSVLVAIEIADSSLNYDKGCKTGIYAAYGVHEVWVVDAIRAAIWVHRRLGANGYAEIEEFPPSEFVTPMLAPELALRLSDFGIGPVDH
ncbi:MAG: Uma2 family endonuclease [Methylocystis sp.]